MILPILTGTDNATLRTKSTRVTKFDGELKKLAKQMVETMLDEKNPGVGLAAPQVGKNIRLVIVDIAADDRENAPQRDPRPVVMINPEIVATSGGKIKSEEGCLSLPKKYGYVWRDRDVTVRYQDLSGKTQMLNLGELPSRCIQHEIDHLDGVLFVDRVLPEMETLQHVRREDVL